jgi:hypothetical protein
MIVEILQTTSTSSSKRPLGHCESLQRLKKLYIHNNLMRISNKLYEETIKRTFSAHAGDEAPDPEAVREVQKAVSLFIKNILT